MVKQSPQIKRLGPSSEPNGPAASVHRRMIARAGLTPRSLLIGLILTVLVDLWVHWAGSSSSPAAGEVIARSSIRRSPSVRSVMLFVVDGGQPAVPSDPSTTSWHCRKAEILVIYVMMTTSCVLSSSGQLHFIVPTIAAAWHYATPSNGWATTFQQYVPDWLAQKNPTVLAGFYNGKTSVPWALWMPQLVAWIGLVISLAAATLLHCRDSAEAMGRAGVAFLSNSRGTHRVDGRGHADFQESTLLARRHVPLPCLRIQLLRAELADRAAAHPPYQCLTSAPW